MPDEAKTGQDAQNTQSIGATGGTQSGADQQQSQGKIEDLPTWAQTLVKELRSEAADRRIALQKQQQESAAAEQKRLADLGQWELLAKKREEELNAAKPYQERAATLEKIIDDNNSQMIAQIPEDMRDIVPPLAADALNAWLVKNMPRLARKQAPNINAGEGSGGGGAKPLTDQDRANARRAGISDEDWAKQLAKLNGQS